MRRLREVGSRGAKAVPGRTLSRRCAAPRPTVTVEWPGTSPEGGFDADTDLVIIKVPGLDLISPNRIRGASRGAALSHARTKRQQRELGQLVTLSKVPLPFRKDTAKGMVKAEITIVRISPYFFDDDNFISSCKALRDGIADGFGLKDNSPYLEFWYEQRKNETPRQREVHIEVRWRDV